MVLTLVGITMPDFNRSGPIAPGKLAESKLNLPSSQLPRKNVVNPELFLPGARSIIMVGLSYYAVLFPEGEVGCGVYSPAPPGGGIITGSWRERLSWLGAALKGFDPGLIYRPFVDTGPLPERELARRAGLGWIGTEYCLINDVYGSWIFLGGMVMNRELERIVQWRLTVENVTDV